MISREAGRSRLRVIRGTFLPRGVKWRPFAVEGTASTNRLWRGSGPSGEWLLKWYRYPSVGVHPEPEVAEFLTAQRFDGAAAFGARLDASGDDGSRTVAFIQSWLEGSSVWEDTVSAMLSGDSKKVFAADLGRTVGRLHHALGSGAKDSSFNSERWSETSQNNCMERISQSVASLEAAFDEAPPESLAAGSWRDARNICHGALSGWQRMLRTISELNVGGQITRIHGDLHLGQFLERRGYSGSNRFAVVDFEGEPMRSNSERRVKDSPLRDVAGMFRSFAYSAAVAGKPKDVAEHWSAEFLSGWLEEAPQPSGEWEKLLSILIWEKAIYEALYELNHRPDWLWIPLRALEGGF